MIVSLISKRGQGMINFCSRESLIAKMRKMKKKMNQFFENLTISASASNDETFNVHTTHNAEVNEQFIISLDVLDASESSAATKVLANDTFKHRFILSDEIFSIASVPYVFNASIDSRYDFSKFKSLLIDSGAATRSTEDMGQLKTLQKFDSTIKFDTSTVGSANFIFDMNSTGSIESINLNTSIGLIIFHIVQINIFFSLCFVDLDRVNVYFNNVNNRIIQMNRFYPVIRRYGHVFLM